jgi:hypothetical protein
MGFEYPPLCVAVPLGRGASRTVLSEDGKEGFEYPPELLSTLEGLPNPSVGLTPVEGDPIPDLSELGIEGFEYPPEEGF